MQVKLMGLQRVNFTDRETGEVIQGTKLHVLSKYEEESQDFKGKRVCCIFTRLPKAADLEVGRIIDLVYDQVLGSTRTRLVDVVPVDEKAVVNK